jgi:hypothetical protein
MSETQQTPTFTVDTRDVFTVHKGGCAHIRHEGQQLNITPRYPRRSSILAELDALGYSDGVPIEEVVDFAPCVSDLP